MKDKIKELLKECSEEEARECLENVEKHLKLKEKKKAAIQ